MSATLTIESSASLSNYLNCGGEPDSHVNQRIRSDLVGREVVHCASSLISYLFKVCGDDSDEVDHDELMALSERRMDHSERIEELEELIEELETSVSDLDEEHVESDVPGDALLSDGETTYSQAADRLKSLQNEIEELKDEQDNPSEVYEHWIVTEYFKLKLAEHGETVGEIFDFHIWGRCTTGQSISIDHVIAEVAASMQILEGQKYDWSKK